MSHYNIVIIHIPTNTVVLCSVEKMISVCLFFKLYVLESNIVKVQCTCVCLPR